MQRFEHPHRYAFAEIQRRGNVVTVREGIFGHPGHARPYAYPVAQWSRHHDARAKSDWRADGYLPCPPGRRLPVAPDAPARAIPLPCPDALAAQLAADPDDEAAWTVWADWLTQRGDPRGRLLHPETDGRTLRRRARAVIPALPGWLGPLWAVVTASRPSLRAVWRGGCVIEAELLEGDEPAVRERTPAQLAACPAARFLRRLVIRDHRPQDLEAMWDCQWDSLRRIDLHADRGEIDPRRVLRAAPRMIALRMQASLADHHWQHPTLERLRISGRDDPPLPLAGLFASADLPALRQLELGRIPFDATAITALCTGPLVAGLQKLVLPGCRISDPAVDALLAHAHALQGLETIDLQHNALWHRAVELRAMFGDRVRLSEAPIYY